jgi:hypothetical protein
MPTDNGPCSRLWSPALLKLEAAKEEYSMPAAAESAAICPIGPPYGASFTNPARD